MPTLHQPSDTPSELSSRNPSVSPSGQPSRVPSTIPSDSPSTIPSDAPTSLAASDFCSQANLVPPGTYYGSTSGLPVDTTEAAACGLIDSPGVWYRVLGTGGQMMVHTCDSGTVFDTFIGIFVGDCGSLACFDYNDDDGICNQNPYSSSVSWSSVAGVEYFVFVFGWDASEEGDFVLTVGAPSPAPTPFPTVTNAPSSLAASDTCSGANLIPTGVFYGSTAGLPVDATEAAPCVASIESPGVWYRVLGTGGPMMAHTCDSGTVYDTFIAVFVGNCGKLTCLAYDDDASICSQNSRSSSVSWSSVAGVEYSVFVFGYDDEQGDFVLTVGDPSPAPTPSPTSLPSVSPSEMPTTTMAPSSVAASDTCSGANLIPTGVFYGSTAGLPVDAAEAPCGSIDSPGVWYRVLGTGGQMMVHTCDSGTVFDTLIDVYVGACGSLVCFEYNDDDGICNQNPGSSSVSWSSVAGVEYFVFVFGWDMYEEGDFVLTVGAPSPAPTPSPTSIPSVSPSEMPTTTMAPSSVAASDTCSGANLIPTGVFYGSTTGLPVDTTEASDCFGSIYGPGVWYRVLGTGGQMMVHTCDSATTYDTELAVLQGVCGSLVCVDYNQDDGICSQNTGSSSVSWSSVAGVEYLVFVGGYYVEEGDFVLTVGSPSPAPTPPPTLV